MVASPLAPYSARWIQTSPTVTYRKLWPKTSHSGNRTRHHDQCTLLVSFSTANATHRNPAKENPSIWIGGRISRDLRYPPVVVLEKTTQAFATLDGCFTTLRQILHTREQQNVPLPLVIPLTVIMLAEVFQGAAQRAFPKQNEMRKTFAFHRAHPSLREGVQIRAARRQSQALHTSGCQRLSKVRAELGIAVVQHIVMATQISRFVVHRVAGHLSHPCFGRMPGDPAQGHAPAFQMQEEQNVVRHQAPPR